MSLYGSSYHEDHAAERRQRDADAAEGARIRKLREQGVRLVDLREVVEWLRNDAPPVGYVPLLVKPLERRFGSDKERRISE